MQEYLDAVAGVLENGTYKENRTDADTIADFHQEYTIDLGPDDGYPLLTTKDMHGFRWNSMLNEFLWYLSGHEHVRTLQEQSGIWDEWSDEQGRLETAYGRFWRRYPVPPTSAQLDGEAWIDADSPYTVEEDGDLVFDQVASVFDALNGEHPHRGPESRRLIINAWHPANAVVSKLPPCHYTFETNVQDDKLNTHLEQRSADLALGVPFNIACYSLLNQAMAQETPFEQGQFGHTLVDAHVYCGTGERGAWYEDNLPELQERMAGVEERAEYRDVRDWVLDEAPAEDCNPDAHDYGYDHVPGLLEQLAREPKDLPDLQLPDGWFQDAMELKDDVDLARDTLPDAVNSDERVWFETVYLPRQFDRLVDVVSLTDYESESGIAFEVAE